MLHIKLQTTKYNIMNVKYRILYCWKWTIKNEICDLKIINREDHRKKLFKQQTNRQKSETRFYLIY